MVSSLGGLVAEIWSDDHRQTTTDIIWTYRAAEWLRITSETLQFGPQDDLL